MVGPMKRQPSEPHSSGIPVHQDGEDVNACDLDIAEAFSVAIAEHRSR